MRILNLPQRSSTNFAKLKAISLVAWAWKNLQGKRIDSVDQKIKYPWIGRKG